jgi:photosystem II stability/assembly factor-like uncharacterized protein
VWAAEGEENAWIATGGSDIARILATRDGGETWTLTTNPPVQGALFCLPSAIGPRQRRDDAYEDDLVSDDEAWGDHQRDRTVVITTETQPNFTSGAAAWTPDEGESWFVLPNVSGYWAVAFANPRAGWFVGNQGQILKISF